MGRFRRRAPVGRRSLKKHAQEVRQQKKPKFHPSDNMAISKRMPLAKTEWTLYIKTLCGRVFTVMVHPYDTILDIREKIEMKEGISPDMQTLYFHGLKLDDGQLMDYHITRDSMLYLTLRLRGG